MANSKYEYVKSFEVEDEVMLPNLIVVRIDGRDFRRFSEVHEFEKPDDGRALNLMNACATAVLEEYSDIVFSYGFSDEYSFVFKKTSKFYQRRASKLLSLIVSFFSSVYVMKWKEFFPEKELKYPPSFHSRVICCASKEVLQAYLAWRQNDCGESEGEAQKLLKVEENVKYNENGTPVKRLRRKARIVHSENIAGKNFWNEHLSLLKEVGGFTEDVEKIKPEFVRSFQFENKLMPSTWIVIRIDGCHFHRFSEVHEFEKPNDKQALNLMNSCAVAVLEEIQDIIFTYGVSDEYSFVLKKDSQFYQRRASEIVSVTVSFFSSMYVMKWKEFFPQKELKYPPSFDGRVVCYPSSKILLDYLAWRQVDCHINNQYNTCFWMLVKKKGKSKSEAQHYLKGTQAKEKNELLTKEFGIDYNELEIMFRQGSLAFWLKEDKNMTHESKGCVQNSHKKEDKNMTHESKGCVQNSHKKVIVEHCDIIKPNFWEAHPSILDENLPIF
ncbi:trna(his) guanylyltransferase 1 [Quercus suber]|uniref:tRNA(His) guanylyltransferase n=1 Tax=Quercus suber TaxID=58331 RepID=A0AAW0M6B2_QUESU